MPMAVQLSPTVCRHMMRGGHEPVDGAVAVDHEVGADPGQLAELHVRGVGGERVEHGRERGRGGVVLHDHPRAPEPEVVEAVVASRVGAHLAPAGLPERDRDGDDWLRRHRFGAARARPGRAGDVRRREGRPPGSSTTNAVSPRERVVLPAGRGAVVARQAPARQPGARE